MIASRRSIFMALIMVIAKISQGYAAARPTRRPSTKPKSSPSVRPIISTRSPTQLKPTMLPSFLPTRLPSVKSSDKPSSHPSIPWVELSTSLELEMGLVDGFMDGINQQRFESFLAVWLEFILTQDKLSATPVTVKVTSQHLRHALKRRLAASASAEKILVNLIFSGSQRAEIWSPESNSRFHDNLESIFQNEAKVAALLDMIQAYANADPLYYYFKSVEQVSLYTPVLETHSQTKSNSIIGGIVGGICGVILFGTTLMYGRTLSIFLQRRICHHVKNKSADVSTDGETAINPCDHSDENDSIDTSRVVDRSLDEETSSDGAQNSLIIMDSTCSDFYFRNVPDTKITDENMNDDASSIRTFTTLENLHAREDTSEFNNSGESNCVSAEQNKSVSTCDGYDEYSFSAGSLKTSCDSDSSSVERGNNLAVGRMNGLVHKAEDKFDGYDEYSLSAFSLTTGCDSDHCEAMFKSSTLPIEMKETFHDGSEIMKTRFSNSSIIGDTGETYDGCEEYSCSLGSLKRSCHLDTGSVENNSEPTTLPIEMNEASMKMSTQSIEVDMKMEEIFIHPSDHDEFSISLDLENGSVGDDFETGSLHNSYVSKTKKRREYTRKTTTSSRSASLSWTRRECIAPSGKLLVILGTSKFGSVVVCEVKSHSPMENILFVGDRICQIDDIDTTGMNSTEVTRIMAQKVDSPRKLIVMGPTPKK